MITYVIWILTIAFWTNCLWWSSLQNVKTNRGATHSTCNKAQKSSNSKNHMLRCSGQSECCKNYTRWLHQHMQNVFAHTTIHQYRVILLMLSTKVYIACVRLKRLPIVDAWFIEIIPFYRTDRACLKTLMRIADTNGRLRRMGSISCLLKFHTFRFRWRDNFLFLLIEG